MIPVTLPPNVIEASPEVLDMIKCCCTTDTRCLTAMCGCYKAHLPCTMFCGCYGEVNYRKEYTRWVDIVDDCDSGDLCFEQILLNVQKDWRQALTTYWLLSLQYYISFHLFIGINTSHIVNGYIAYDYK